jgi:N-acetyl-anhydromuramyl-L-alanine amidase AmpD
MPDPAPVSVNTPNVIDLQAIMVSVRTDFRFVKKDGSIVFHWGGEEVKGATVELVAGGRTVDQELTDHDGRAWLETSQLTEGDYIVRITPVNSRNEPAGPRIAERDPDPLPLRMYNPLEVTVHLAGGAVASASIDPKVKYAGLGNRLQKEWPPKTLPTDHLPIDLKPIWMRAPRRTDTKTRGIDEIQLFVIHNTSADPFPEAWIGPDINTFIGNSALTVTIPAGTEAPGQIHYLMDFNGHVIKFMKDTEVAIHAGGKWHGRFTNAMSIGIELVHKEEKESNHPPLQLDRDHVPEYTDDQYASLLDFISRLHDAYAFDRTQVVGHSDVGTTPAHVDLLVAGRDQDPGQVFRWEKLEALSWGMIPSAANVSITGAYGGIFDLDANIMLQENDNDGITQPGNHTKARHGGPPKHGTHATPLPAGSTATPIKELQEDLVRIGYSLLTTADRTTAHKVGIYDELTTKAVEAFQRHFFSGNRRREKKPEHDSKGKVDMATAQMIKNVLGGSIGPP